jgi:tetratricopeptide (TPR) repeat protein
LQLLDEKIRNAYLVATSGDLNATDTAIMEIEKLGASPGQARLLRGVVAYFRQDPAGAIRELEQAVELLPDSVAARALLAMSYTDNVQWERYEQVMLELRRLPPSSPEDYLFKGYALEVTEPGLGLADVNEGLRRRDSPLGRAIRAFVRANLATDTAKVEDAEAALAEADVAIGMQPNNPMVLYTSLVARLTAAGIYQDAGLHEKRTEVLAKAAQQVRALEPFMGLHNPDYILWHYYEATGEPAKALEFSRRSLNQSGNSVAAVNCVLTLYRQGQFSEALKCLDQRRQADLIGDTTRVFVLAELANDTSQAVAEYDTLARKYPQVNIQYLGQLLLFLGKKDQALAHFRKFHPPFDYSPEWKEFYEAMRQYGCGELSEERYLATAGASRWKQCYAHFDIAMFRLADGDREGAKEHFAKVVNTRAIWPIQWPWSVMFLSRLENDPAWPKWIPPKNVEPKP